MNDKNHIVELKSDHLAGRRGGVFSVCSSHPAVLAAAMETAAEEGFDLLVEATANQVNQFGGYTGMTPGVFVSFVRNLAAETRFPVERIQIGADHLGPHVWKDREPQKALDNAIELAGQCITAGFGKIHIDTITGCREDLKAAARQAATICRACEAAAAARAAGGPGPLYVIGAEVPPPGGALENPETLKPTDPGYVLDVLDISKSAFSDEGLDSAWQRVLAMVVQPGVEFGDENVAVYRSEKAQSLSALHATLPGIMTYEIHSTDFQPPHALMRLVRDHFPLLKVGPCLTYAFREAVFALESIESELLAHQKSVRHSQLRESLETVMMQKTVHWHDHYDGSAEKRFLLRAFSYRDRIRYYWTHPIVQKALYRLIANLTRPIPPGLLTQYFPDFCTPGQPDMPDSPQELILLKIRKQLTPYAAACR